MEQKDNKNIKKKYKHISFQERCIIEYLFKENKSKMYISKKLLRDRKTIEKEIKRNGYENKRGHWNYNTNKAEIKRIKRRLKANHKHIKLNKFTNIGFFKMLVSLLKSKKGLSVDAIIGRYKLEKGDVPVSTSTVYRYINLYNQELKKYLRHKGLKYGKNKYKRCGIPGKIKELNPIGERPEIINNRERKGDYELDLVVSGRGGKEVLLTVVDRYTDYFMFKKLKNKSKKEVRIGILEVLSGKIIESLTIDNGLEFTDVIDICKEKGIEGYRCDPYSSWQKGINERHNGLIRFYIPKGANIGDYSENYIKDIEQKINNLPRKIFGYKTPSELYFNKTENIF